MQDDYTTQAAVPSAAENGAASSALAENQLQAQLDAANARAEDNYNKFLLAMADFENYKKRIERQFKDIADSGRRDLLKNFLPVLDNLERALSFERRSAQRRAADAQGVRGRSGHGRRKADQRQGTEIRSEDRRGHRYASPRRRR